MTVCIFKESNTTEPVLPKAVRFVDCEEHKRDLETVYIIRYDEIPLSPPSYYKLEYGQLASPIQISHRNRFFLAGELYCSKRISLSKEVPWIPFSLELPQSGYIPLGKPRFCPLVTNGIVDIYVLFTEAASRMEIIALFLGPTRNCRPL